AVEEKIGDNAPVGAVFHNRRLTGEVLQPNAPGRDPVITRIIWLRGLEAQNAHAFQRCIYIHGTPQEKTIGQPASYGCIRMKSSDITALYDRVPPGALVQIVADRLPKLANIKVPRSEASDGVVAVSAPIQNETPNRDSLPKLQKRPPVEPTDTTVAAMALAAPPEHLTQNQPPAQDATETGNETPQSDCRANANGWSASCRAKKSEARIAQALVTFGRGHSASSTPKAAEQTIVATCGFQSRIVWVDNRNCAHERSFHKSLIYNGQYEISRQTLAPDAKTYASQ